MNSKIAAVAAVIVAVVLVIVIVGFQGSSDKDSEQPVTPEPQTQFSMSMSIEGTDDVCTRVSFDATGIDYSESNTYYYSEPAEVRIRAYSTYPVLSVDVTFSDDQYASIINRSGSYYNTTSSYKYDGTVTVSLLPGSDITCSVVIKTEQPRLGETNRYMGIDAEDGISVRLNSQAITGLLSTESQMLEIISPTAKNIAVLIKENKQIVKTQSSDSPVTRMYVDLPASELTSDSTGMIYIAYAEDGKSTPEYTIYLPECIDTSHPTTSVTYTIDGGPVSPGLVTLTNFASLGVKVQSDEYVRSMNVRLFGTSYAYNACHGMGGAYIDGFEAQFSDDSVLNWVEGNYLLSIEVCYLERDRFPEEWGSTITTVNINSDILHVTERGSPNQRLVSGDQVENTTLYISVPDDSAGTLHFTSHYDTDQYSVWLSGVSHSEGYQIIALTLPHFILEKGNNVYGSITLNWTAD